MRTCVQCGAPDRPVATADGEEHWVVPELRWMAPGQLEVSQRDGRAGWRPRQVQGRRAMERMICRECLEQNAVRDEVWREIRKAAKERESGGADKYWLTLCES